MVWGLIIWPLLTSAALASLTPQPETLTCTSHHPTGSCSLLSESLFMLLVFPWHPPPIFFSHLNSTGLSSLSLGYHLFWEAFCDLPSPSEWRLSRSRSSVIWLWSYSYLKYLQDSEVQATRKGTFGEAGFPCLPPPSLICDCFRSIGFILLFSWIKETQESHSSAPCFWTDLSGM